MATSLFPAMAERTETTSSGVEVPTATIVSPMMNSGTRKRWARAADPSVRKFAPARISARPVRRRSMSIFKGGVLRVYPSRSRLTAIRAMPATTP